VRVDRYGASTPEEVVAAALAAGLDAIAVTDHNTAEWCDRMSDAAEGTELTVLPGVEISTAEGHLLAVWEVGTAGTVIDEALVLMGIGAADRGKLDVAADVGFREAAAQIAKSGGVAIAAHIDRSKGLLSLTVADHLHKTLMSEDLCAVEVINDETVEIVASKIAGKRELPCVRGSDCTVTGGSEHVLAGIGSRRTWIKAAAPDLIGLRHALADPELRIKLAAPDKADYPRIESVRFEGGFLGGQTVHLSPDLNCLLGSTGAGKSLVLEAIRFVLDQQVDADQFPEIAKEVSSRLQYAIGQPGDAVIVTVVVGNESYEVERSYQASASPAPQVRQLLGGVLTQVDVPVQELLRVSAFSQGEVLEYSREPVGRMSLIDASIDLTEIERQIAQTTTALTTNAKAILQAREDIRDLEVAVESEAEVDERVTDLSGLYDKDKAERQDNWSKDKVTISSLVDALPGADADLPAVPAAPDPPTVAENQDVFEGITSALGRFETRLAAVREEITAAVADLTTEVAELRSSWDERHQAFEASVEADLIAAGRRGETLRSIRTQLAAAQTEKAAIEAAKRKLVQEARPRMAALLAERETMLDALQRHRDDRRAVRRARVDELNSKMAGIVKLDIPAHPDHESYYHQLRYLKTGSNLRDTVIEAITTFTHPFKLVRSLLGEDLNSLVKADKGIDLGSISKLYAHVDTNDLWDRLFELQTIDQPDTLTVKFKKQDGAAFVEIDQLAHGEKCTAILVMLLADGTSPIIVDQPEDALHAPWIEDHLVGRLRDLRGSRQYIFATRSPGIVVSADAEQIVTLTADRGRGSIEAEGSLERHELNALALHHLEGGPTPFRRRSQKLAPSISA
jgi:hypothetical protein